MRHVELYQEHVDELTRSPLQAPSPLGRALCWSILWDETSCPVVPASLHVDHLCFSCTTQLFSAMTRMRE